MAFKPTGNKILVKREAGVAKVGVLDIPEDSRERPDKGLVLAAGPDSEFKEGDTVVFPKWTGFDYGDNIVMPSDEVWGTDNGNA
jgi:co-chaperonin GroES (HSP10)